MSPDIDFTVITQEELSNRLADSLMIVSKRDYEDSREVLGQLVVVSYFSEEMAKLQVEGIEKTGKVGDIERCCQKALEQIYKNYPDLLDVDEQRGTGFGADFPKFLDDHAGMPNTLKGLLSKMIEFYHSKQHPEFYKQESN